MKRISKKLIKIKDILEKHSVKKKYELKIIRILVEIMKDEESNIEKFNNYIDAGRIEKKYLIFDSEANKREKKVLNDIIIRKQKKIDRLENKLFGK